MSSSSGRVVAVIVLGLVSIPLVLVAVLSGSGGEDGGLTLERDQQGLVVYVQDRALNKPATANGRTSVTLECLDSSDSVVFRRRTPWPLSDTDAGQLPSHSHQAISPDQLGAIARCRLAGTRGPLEGEVAAR
jgi:hypothetical protein